MLILGSKDIVIQITGMMGSPRLDMGRLSINILTRNNWTEEMSQWLRAYTAVPEDQSSNSNTYFRQLMTVYNSISSRSNA